MIADNLVKLANIKNDIKQAINDKGVSVQDNMSEYADAIRNIPSGSNYGTHIALEGLTYLDERPVTEEDRICAEAYLKTIKEIAKETQSNGSGENNKYYGMNLILAHMCLHIQELFHMKYLQDILMGE